MAHSESFPVRLHLSMDTKVLSFLVALKRWRILLTPLDAAMLTAACVFMECALLAFTSPVVGSTTFQDCAEGPSTDF